VTISGGNIDLDQDFGYRALTNPNSISGTIWNDVDADGTLDGGENGRYEGVTVVLRDSDGNIVATTTTDSNGDYSFAGLPDGTYTVDVTDSGNVLNGLWHSTGLNPGDDNNSQSDPYTVTVSGGQTNATADFGYYGAPAALGNFVWLDLDNDGIQDSNEPGIGGVVVTLTVDYPNGDSVTVATVTDANGYYSFGNLLLDESFAVADGAAGTPTYTLTFAMPPGTTASPIGAGGDPELDSNGASFVVGPLYQGQTDLSYDSGFYTERLDLGDLPNAYGTLFPNAAAHVVFPDTDANGLPNSAGSRPAVWLGLAIETELDGQPSLLADGDGDEEDGLKFRPTGWIAGESSVITVTLNASEAGVTVHFGLWIDWNDDGEFDAFYNGSGITSQPGDGRGRGRCARWLRRRRVRSTCACALQTRR
jgi:hypothetical protein